MMSLGLILLMSQKKHSSYIVLAGNAEKTLGWMAHIIQSKCMSFFIILYGSHLLKLQTYWSLSVVRYSPESVTL